MILIQRNSTNPYFNIAAEEYFLKNYSEDIIMFWQSSPSVIVGKHQNTLAEVNHNFVNKNDIPVIRRISGGGTVYHDEGNINYTIITSSESREHLVDFISFTKPIIAFLGSLGLDTMFEGKNNITFNGRKFSGNSAHVFKNRIINHGTLLFNTNLSNLESAINPGDINITDKAVKSIRATVTNLADHIHISKKAFKDKLVKYFLNYFNILNTYELTDNDRTSIEELVRNKYKHWDWNYGYSPTYNYSNNVNGINLSMEIQKGLITRIDIAGKLDYKDEICGQLINSPFRREVIEPIVKEASNNESDIKLYLTLLGFN